RDFYEAFVIAAFFALLTQYVGDAPEEKKEKLRNKHQMRYPFPCGFITYEPTSHTHLLFVKWGVLQYVVFAPLITISALITEALGVYCSESMSFHFARVYLSIVKFFSVTLAMYALITFYVTIKSEIDDEKPLYKFACVIFLTFWQNLILSILADAGVIKPSQYWTSSNISRGLNALIICCEMVLFAFLHVIAFDYRRYRDHGQRKHTRFLRGLKSAFNFMDVVREIAFIIKYVWYLFSGKELPDSTSKALNIYGAIHADDPNAYTPLETVDGEDTQDLEAKVYENVDENTELREKERRGS
ncbi:176_t:CDS:2, partial [Acaulospora morrowiae]